MTDKAPSKSDQVRALREARADAAERVARGLAMTNPEAKATKGKSRSAGNANKGARKIPVTPPAGVASRLGAGRTAQDRGKPKGMVAIAIQKRGPGRPKIEGKRPWEAAGLSKRTYYRRKAEGKL